MRNLTIFLTVGAIAAFSLWYFRSPPFGPSLKVRIVNEIGDILRDEAYAEGVAFPNWQELATRNHKDIDASTTAEAFAATLDIALASPT